MNKGRKLATIKQIGNLLDKSFSKWDYNKAIKLSENESQTRDYLIEPFFNLLGYNKMEHYSHEFSLKFAKGSVKKVDMVISLNRRTSIKKFILKVEPIPPTLSKFPQHFPNTFRN